MKRMKDTVKLGKWGGHRLEWGGLWQAGQTQELRGHRGTLELGLKGTGRQHLKREAETAKCLQDWFSHFRDNSSCLERTLNSSNNKDVLQMSKKDLLQCVGRKKVAVLMWLSSNSSKSSIKDKHNIL